MEQCKWQGQIYEVKLYSHFATNQGRKRRISYQTEHLYSVVSDSLQPHFFTAHGILQTRILEWVAFPFSRRPSQPRIEPRSPTLLADSLPAEPQGKPLLRKGVWKEIYHNIQILSPCKLSFY